MRKDVSDVNKSAATRKNALKKRYSADAEELQLRYESFLHKGFNSDQAFALTVLYLKSNLGG